MAGFSSYFKERFNINSYITSIICSGFCYIILNRNIQGIIKVSTLCVPVIVIVIIILGLNCLNQGFEKICNMNLANNSIGLSCISAILYAGYNSILLIPVIITLKRYCNNNNIKFIAVMIHILIGLLGFFIYVILLRGNYNIM